MAKPVVFKFKLLDTRFFPANVTIPAGAVFEFFSHQTELNDNDVTKEIEEKIIQWFIKSGAQDLLYTQLGVNPGSFIDFGVKKPVILDSQKKPGDIDILICPDCIPELAIAIQAKPIIVKALNASEDDDPKCLSHLKLLVEQANKQAAKYGFYRNYLMVIIKVDGRKKVDFNPLYRGVNPETFQKIYNNLKGENINDDIGIIYLEIIQPTGKKYNDYVLVAVGFERDARPLDPQLAETTNRVKALMLEKGIMSK